MGNEKMQAAVEELIRTCGKMQKLSEIQSPVRFKSSSTGIRFWCVACACGASFVDKITRAFI